MVTTTELSGAAWIGLIDAGVAKTDHTTSPVYVRPFRIADLGCTNRRRCGHQR